MGGRGRGRGVLNRHSDPGRGVCPLMPLRNPVRKSPAFLRSPGPQTVPLLAFPRKEEGRGGGLRATANHRSCSPCSFSCSKMFNPFTSRQCRRYELGDPLEEYCSAPPFFNKTNVIFCGTPPKLPAPRIITPFSSRWLSPCFLAGCSEALCLGQFKVSVSAQINSKYAAQLEQIGRAHV